MISLSIDTCIKALHSAALSRRAVIQTELAVGFAIFLYKGSTEREARQLLVEAYATAGYACLTPTDPDYKTINRRVNATADLFNKIKPRTVKKWAGDLAENNLIAAMVEGLRPYELHTISDVQRFCTPPETVQAGSTPGDATGITPHSDILSGGRTGQDKVVAMFRRAADHAPQDARRIETNHLRIVVTNETPAEELIELAWKIFDLAIERKPELQRAAA